MTANDVKVSMTPSHPGEFVRREVIEELGLTVTKAAEVLGVRRATLSELLNGRASLSPEMALRIEKAFNTNMDMLLRMQAWHDASKMRARSRELNVKRYVPAPDVELASVPAKEQRMPEGDTEDQRGSEEELRHRLRILQEKFREGKIRIAKGLDVERSLLAVRTGPDGEVDLDTVDGSVRAMALAVTVSQDREELKIQFLSVKYKIHTSKFLKRTSATFTKL